MSVEGKMLVAMVLAVFGLALFLHFGNKLACEQQSVSFVNSSYGFYSGCMVEHDGQWLPLDNIRGFD